MRSALLLASVCEPDVKPASISCNPSDLCCDFCAHCARRLIRSSSTGPAPQVGWRASAGACCGHWWRCWWQCRCCCTGHGGKGTTQEQQRQLGTDRGCLCTHSCRQRPRRWHCLHPAGLLLPTVQHHQPARRKASTSTKPSSSRRQRRLPRAAAAMERRRGGSAAGTCMQMQRAAAAAAALALAAINNSRKVLGASKAVVQAAMTASRSRMVRRSPWPPALAVQLTWLRYSSPAARPLAFLSQSSSSISSRGVPAVWLVGASLQLGATAGVSLSAQASPLSRRTAHPQARCHRHRTQQPQQQRCHPVVLFPPVMQHQQHQQHNPQQAVQAT